MSRSCAKLSFATFARRFLEKQSEIKRWLGIILVVLLCGSAVIVVCYRVSEWLYARKHPKIPISEAIGVYSWDMSEFYPPGSPEAKRFLAPYISNIDKLDLKTDRYIYVRKPSPFGEDGDNPFIWDFPISEEMKKQWQEKIKANKASEAIGTNAPQPQR